ncbi:Uu.00g137470.m01.CDS01 [Anthostomella pinea]|uniref:Uu.00g137470.m01.CDS01 n=1 Tax=Anthostomella pinea TaxID=933095 RepID=A0AAI8VPK5_9PEZI|nr:Uu.00g137470.m01.CDS01 [Anthostomella pinea]
MAAPKNSRKYDLVLVGASGYTGSLTAEYIVNYLPDDLKWVIVGRSEEKLESLAAVIKGMGAQRLQPAVEVVSFGDREEFHRLINSAKVCVTYWRIGEMVVEACAENSTDYIDCAGDTYLWHGFNKRYHEKAVTNEAALIQSCGIFTGPQDLLTWVAVRELVKRRSAKTKEVILSVIEASFVASAGSVESFIHQKGRGPEAVQASRDPWALSPVRGVSSSASTNLFGIRHDSTLGLLANSATGAPQDRAVIHKTWGLLQGTDKSYGDRFQYNEFDKVTSTKLAKRYLPPLSAGPDVEKTRDSPVKMEAVAVAEPGSGEKKKKKKKK